MALSSLGPWARRTQYLPLPPPPPLPSVSLFSFVFVSVAIFVLLILSMCPSLSVGVGFLVVLGYMAVRLWELRGSALNRSPRGLGVH